MGGSEAEDRKVADREALIETVRHPLRLRVLNALSERPDVTIRQLSARLDESPRRVRHQVSALVDLGLVVVSGEVRRRGVVERRYATRTRVEFPSGDDLPSALRLRLSREIVKLLLADFTVASSAGTLAGIPDRYECRFYGEVDDRCIEQLVGIHERAYREIRDTFEAGRERIRESGERGTEVVSALFFFEAPLWGPIVRAPARDDAKRE